MSPGERSYLAVHDRPGLVFTVQSCPGTEEPGTAYSSLLAMVGKCSQEAMVETSNTEVGDLSGVLVVSVRVGRFTLWKCY